VKQIRATACVSVYCGKLHASNIRLHQSKDSIPNPGELKLRLCNSTPSIIISFQNVSPIYSTKNFLLE